MKESCILPTEGAHVLRMFLTTNSDYFPNSKNQLVSRKRDEICSGNISRSYKYYARISRTFRLKSCLCSGRPNLESRLAA